MNGNSVIQFPLKIETISSLHIGSGEKWNCRLDLVQEKGNVFLIDREALFKKAETNMLLHQDLVSLYESENGTITDFLSRHNISFNTVCQKSGTIDYCISSCQLSSREVLSVIKVANNLVFIPGSSLKGGIRSSLLRNNLSDSKIRQIYQEKIRAFLSEMDKKMKKCPKKQNEILKDYKRKISNFAETSFFGLDQHHDILRCIQFADSEVKDVSCLAIKEIKILSVLNNTLQIKGIQQRRDKQRRDIVINAEVIKPGQIFNTTVTFNQYLLLQKPAISELRFNKDLILQFFKYCQQASSQLIKQEIEFFNVYKENRIKDWYEKNLLNYNLENNQCFVRLSWGSGFDAKTIIDLFNKDLFDDLRWKFNLGKFTKDQTGKMIEPFPKSRKIVFENNQPKEPLGWVKLTLGS